MGSYDVAQICLNGHVVTSTAGTTNNFQKKYCQKCGEITTMNCTHCSSTIKGYYNVSGYIGISEYTKPNFCDNCGKAYPWTERKANAAKELVDINEVLSSDEKNDLKKSIDDLIKETPNTPIAQTKFKKYIVKGGKELGRGVRDLLIDLVSETISKGLWSN